MTVKANDLPTNNLNINEIEQNTLPNSLELGSGKEGEYTYSKTLAKLLRRFVRVVVPNIVRGMTMTNAEKRFRDNQIYLRECK